MIQRVATPAQLNQHLTSNMPMGNAHLGAEYYNIGSAIADGRGFSDPFVVQSGPTAWMPPLLVWIQAGLIRLFDGDRYWVMLAVVSPQDVAAVCVCGAAIVRHGWRRSDGWIAFGVVRGVSFFRVLGLLWLHSRRLVDIGWCDGNAVRIDSHRRSRRR